MATIDELQLKFSADISQLNRSIQQVHGQFASLERQVNTTSNRVSASMRGIGTTAKALAATMGAMAFGTVARGAVELADKMTNMQSRLKLVTGSTKSAADMQARLLDIANRTRTPFESVGTLYARLGRSADDLGMSQNQVAQFTETMAQTLKISGASAAESESVILQLSQALGSGQLRGEEFNTIMENGGRAAVAMAKGLNVPIGSLRKMAEEGKLTSSVVIGAIQSQAGTIASEFSQMQLTVGDAFSVLRNDVARTIGEMDKGTGASAALAGQIIDLGKTLRDPEFVKGATSVAQVMVDLAGKIAWAVGQIGIAIEGWKMMAMDLDEWASSKLGLKSWKQEAADATQAKQGSLRHKSRWGSSGSGAPTGMVPTIPKPPALGNARGSSGGGGGGGSQAAALADDTMRYDEAVRELTFDLEQLGRSEEAAAYAATLRNNLQRAGVELDSERGQAIAMLTAQIQQETRAREALTEADREAAEELGKYEEMKKQAGDAVASAFQRAIMEGESLRQVFAGLLADLAKLIFQKMVFETISKTISGGFASGGGVNVGNAYVVGERGPEVFVPKMPGMIVPNRNIGSGSGVVINSVVNAGAGVNREQLSVLLDERDRALTRRLPRLMIDKQRRNALAGAF